MVELLLAVVVSSSKRNGIDTAPHDLLEEVRHILVVDIVLVVVLEADTVLGV